MLFCPSSPFSKWAEEIAGTWWGVGGWTFYYWGGARVLLWQAGEMKTNIQFALLYDRIYRNSEYSEDFFPLKDMSWLGADGLYL
jgi:hypothetical protein